MPENRFEHRDADCRVNRFVQELHEIYGYNQQTASKRSKLFLQKVGMK